MYYKQRIPGIYVAKTYDCVCYYLLVITYYVANFCLEIRHYFYRAEIWGVWQAAKPGTRDGAAQWRFSAEQHTDMGPHPIQGYSEI